VGRSMTRMFLAFGIERRLLCCSTTMYTSEVTLRMQPEDVFWPNEHPYLRVLVTNGGDREHEIILPCFPEAYTALIDYVEKALFPYSLRGPFFRTVDQRTGNVTGESLSARTAHFSINRHAHRAGFEREISLHEFRVAGASLLKEQVLSGLLI